MSNKKSKALSWIPLIIGILSALVWCGSLLSRTIQTGENIIVPKSEHIATESPNQETETVSKINDQNIRMESKDNEKGVSLDKVEVVNAIEFGNPKEVLDNMVMTSNVKVIKTEADELQIEFELENVGLCVFVASKGKELILPEEVFADSTKIKWTASTADGEYIYPYMKVNETGDMFMIDWTYNEYRFAIYGESPQDTSDRDMAGKIALAMIYNLSGEENE